MSRAANGAARAREDAAAAAPAPPGEPAVLIADDQPDVLEALGLLLKREGYRTRTASSPPSVIQALRSHRFDVLLMDLNYARDTTSGREGLDMLRRIREIDECLPVVVMTAWGSVELAVEAMQRGVGDFVQKPWDNARLLSILRTQVARGRAQRTLLRLESAKDAIDRAIESAGGEQSLAETAARIVQEALRCRAVVIAPTPPPVTPSATPAPGAHAIVAVPVAHNGVALTAIHVEPRDDGPLTGPELRFLDEVAERVGLGLHEQQHQEQERELAAACEIQKGFLPRDIPQIAGFSIAALWQPARVVGGDYYDVLAFDGHRAALCIADVVGKGMPAALLMSNLQAAVKACATASTPPRDLCARVNRILCDNIAPGRFVTLFYALLDARSRRLVYAGAGHNAPLLVRPDGRVQRLVSRGRVLGVGPDWSCPQDAVDLGPGDRLVLFTDGVTEARSPFDEEFGEARLVDLVTSALALAPPAIHERIVDALNLFCPDGVQDDATLLTVAAEDVGSSGPPMETTS